MINSRISNIYHQYPRDFWVLSGASFIDRLGGAIIFPYLALYITSKFSVGMTQVGVLFAIFSISSLFGNILGGALTDKFGRKILIIAGLITSSLSSLSMGFVDDLGTFYLLGAFVGFFMNLGSPAHMAMVTDLLPEEQRLNGFGILRVVANLAVTIGPAIGGLLAERSFLLLFIVDSIMSMITAAVVYVYLPETQPEKTHEQLSQNLGQTIAGYLKVVSDKLFMIFLGVSILVTMVAMQLSSSLPVFLRDIHGIAPQGYGYLLSFNAALVVLFQFIITQKISAKPPMIMMALGAAFYLVGFSMYGFVNSMLLFFVAMAVLTVGEMIVSPVAISLVSVFAPEDKRGRYMAVFELSYILPSAIGPLMAGLVMDNHDPNWVWYGAGILCSIAIAAFLVLHNKAHERYQNI